MSDAIFRLNKALKGRYNVERELGEGGMASVYLAADLKHGRKVAIKVLKPELAAVIGGERFLAEIRTTANLQHPHILPLFNSGEADGLLYYVMPFVEGESLRERLDREKQLGVEESVQLARDVASALAYAHREGVIHRDVKPENILLRDGRPLVADFGIALAVSAAGGTRLTETGLSLGTPYYMSPEQATADRELTARSDVYSLACVLYEMLTGDPPHIASTAQAVIAKIIADTPRDARELRGTVPAHVSWALSKALSKLPADRFATAEDFEAALAGTVAMPDAEVPVERPSSWTRRAVGFAPWLVAAAAVGALIFGGSPRAETTPKSWDIALPDSAPLMFVGEATYGLENRALDISRDASHVAYVGQSGPTTALYVRRTDGFEVRALPGTAGAFFPFFSPDGGQIAFFADDQLKVTPTEGGEVSVITRAGDARSGAWYAADEIVLSTQDNRVIVVVRPSDRDRREFTADALGDSASWPFSSSLGILPGGDWMITVCNNANICVYSLERRELRYLVADGEAVGSVEEGPALRGAAPYLLPNGVLVYRELGQSTLLAIGFDPETLETTGQPVRVLNGLRGGNTNETSQMAVAADGTLVYAEGTSGGLGELTWVDRAGNEEVLPFEPRIYGAFALSPDGSRVAAPVITPGGDRELWFLDLERERSRVWPGAYSVITANPFERDSRYVYVHTRDEVNRMLRIDTEGGAESLLVEGSSLWAVQQVLEDGRLLVIGLERGDAWLVEPDPLAGARIPDVGEPVLDGVGGRITFMSVSPDGRWLQYTSDVEGRYEVYAVPLPLTTDPSPIRVSTDGGEEGVWSPNGDGLYYRDKTRWHWVPLADAGDQPFGEPELFAEGNYLNLPGLEYAVSPDGQRILVVRSTAEPTTTRLNVITDWLDVVEARLDEGGSRG